MTEIVKPRSTMKPILLALFGLAVGAQSVTAATTIVLKNNSGSSAEIGFDGAAAIKVAPRDIARMTLNDGEHSIQCRFEGLYDGCNMAERFTIEGARELTLTLAPVFALSHAVALSQAGTLSIETRQDGAWATNTLDVPGTAADCADYASGKLGAVSQAMRPRMAVRNASVAMLNLCGQPHPAIGTSLNGAQVYIPLRFVTFKERNDRTVMVRQ
jgi:hypothetical protein